MRRFVFVLCVFLMGFSCAAEILPLVPGESLIPRGTGDDWNVEGLDGTEARISGSFWYAIMSFNFPGGKEKARAVVSRDYDDLPVGDFDQVVWHLRNRGHPVVATLRVTTDKGVVAAESGEISGRTWQPGSTADLVVDLDGAGFIKNISLECAHTEKTRESSTILRPRLLLRNKNEFNAYMNYWKRFDDIEWEGLLKDESYVPSYQMRYGMLFGQDDLDAWREQYLSGMTPRSFPGSPEKAITPGFAKPRGWEYERIKESGIDPIFRLRPGFLAFHAMLFKDEDLMRLAARYLLSLCAVESWSDAVYPVPITGDNVERHMFVTSVLGFEAALALDCVGEMLTQQGYDYVLKTLMYKAFLPTTYSNWTYGFQWVSNQGASFMRGKLAALLIAERHWERVKPYTDLAKAELDESISFMFRDDGSFMEASAGYLNYTMACMRPVYLNFAAMRGKSLLDVIPPAVAESGAYAQVVASTSRHPGRAIIPFGDRGSSGNYPVDSLAFMATACPDSAWINLFNRLDKERIEEHQSTLGVQRVFDVYMAGGLILSRQYESLRNLEDVAPDNLVLLEHSGLVSSWRDPVKILFIGDSSGVGKKDHDVGSFVLEYEGDIYAMDMGGEGHYGKIAPYHNMLVALDEQGEPANSIFWTAIGMHSPVRDSMRPQATGDDVEFRGVIDATASWAPEYFTKWIRTIDSPNPDELTISDEYVLGENATGAAFIWITYLPCEIDGNKIVITGEYGSKCEITVPADCEPVLEKFIPDASNLSAMVLPEDHECTRIMIKRKGNAGEEGRMDVKARLIPGEE